MLVDVKRQDPVDQTECRFQADRRSFNPLAGGTEPCAKPGAVCSGLMAPVLRRMGDARRGHEPVHQNETQQQGPDQSGSFQCDHNNLLAQRRSLHRLLFLNACHDVVNLLFGQESAFDVLLHDTLFIDEHADRQPEYPELIGDFVVAIHQNRERVPVLLDVFANFRIVFQLIDGQHNKPLVSQPVVCRLHRGHFRRAGLAPCCPKVQKDDLAPMLAKTLCLPAQIDKLKILRRRPDHRHARAHAPGHSGRECHQRHRKHEAQPDVVHIS